MGFLWRQGVSLKLMMQQKRSLDPPSLGGGQYDL
jgi:hypothetical protein